MTKVLGFTLENFLRYLTWKTFLLESKTGTLGSDSTFHWEPVNQISSFYLFKFRSNGWKSMFLFIFLIKPSDLPKVGTNMKPCPNEFLEMTFLLVEFRFNIFLSSIVSILRLNTQSPILVLWAIVHHLICYLWWNFHALERSSFWGKRPKVTKFSSKLWASQKFEMLWYQSWSYSRF